MSYWVSSLNGGTGRPDVVYRFVDSVENRRRQTANVYQGSLLRAPGADELNYWGTSLSNGSARFEDLVAAVSGSREYFRRFF